jgi:uncharacterized repeat protein (TIGR01451 family)
MGSQKVHLLYTKLILVFISIAGLWILVSAFLAPPRLSAHDVLPKTFDSPFESPILAIDKTVEGDVVGAPITYTLTVSNTGPVSATGVIITDIVPTGAGFVSATDEGSLQGGDEVRWTEKTVLPTNTLAVRFTVSTCQEITLYNEKYGVTSTEGVSATGVLVQTPLQAPTVNANFLHMPDPSFVGSAVHFTDTSTTDGSPLVDWAWDFDDGAKDTGPEVSHTYTGPGDFNVTLTVTDSCGYTATRTLTHEVTALASDILSITKEAAGSLVIGAPLTYTITVSNVHENAEVPGVVVTDAVPTDGFYVSGGSESGGVVSLDVGSVPALGQASATWVVSTCEPSLTNEWYRVVTSTPGLTTTWGAEVTTDFSTEPTLIPDFTISPSAAWVNVPLTFEDASTTDGGPITAWHWDFGDTTSDTGSEVAHTFANTGTVTVTLTITDSCGFTATTDQLLTVKEPRIYLPLVLLKNRQRIYLPLVLRSS